MESKTSLTYPALAEVTHTMVPTVQAAYYLHKKPRTLNQWACYANGPIQPKRVNSRLYWPTDAIRQLMGAK